jgi:hypothetical protein
MSLQQATWHKRKKNMSATAGRFIEYMPSIQTKKSKEWWKCLFCDTHSRLFGLKKKSPKYLNVKATDIFNQMKPKNFLLYYSRPWYNRNFQLNYFLQIFRSSPCNMHITFCNCSIFSSLLQYSYFVMWSTFLLNLSNL